MRYWLENGSYILIPVPAAYCIHKMMIHGERSSEKRQKDAASIRNLLYSFENNEQFRTDFKRIFSGLGKKQKIRVTANASIIEADSMIARLIEEPVMNAGGSQNKQ